MNAVPRPRATERVVVVMPTFDEAASLEATARAVLEAAPGIELLVVDDASPDGTGRIADALAAAEARVSVLHRAAREGLGPAYLAGFAAVLDDAERPAAVVVEMDADGSHPASALPALLARLAQEDDPVGLVIGSRWVPGGGIADWARHRSLLSRAGNAYARALLALPVRDATAGFRAYRAEVLRAAIADGVASQGYCFQIDLVRRVVAAGAGVAEVPILFRERAHGRSKMSARIVLEAVWRVTGWGLRRLLGPRAARERGAAARGKGTRSAASLGGFPQGDAPRGAR